MGCQPAPVSTYSIVHQLVVLRRVPLAGRTEAQGQVQQPAGLAGSQGAGQAQVGDLGVGTE